MKKLTRSEKVKIVLECTEYLKNKGENGAIVASTVYKDYPVGQYLIGIRHDILNGGENSKKYSEDEKRKLTEQGLLEIKIVRKTKRIDRLMKFVRDYPKLWDIKDGKNSETAVDEYIKLTEQMEHIENREELIKLLERARSDYAYLRANKSRKKLTEAQITDLDKSKISKVFGDERFRDKYIKDIIGGKEPHRTKKEKRVFIKNFDLAEPDMICRKGYYCSLLQTLFDRKTGIVLTDDIKRIIEFSMNNSNLTANEKFVIKLRHSDPNKLLTFGKIGGRLGVSSARAGQTLKYAFQKLSELPTIKMLGVYLKKVEKQNAQFIKQYFENNDISIGKDAREILGEERNILESLFNDMHLDERMKAKQQEKDEQAKMIGIDVIGEISDLAIGTCQRLEKNGIKNLYDLLQISEKDMQKIRGFGIGKYKKIIESVQFRYGFTLGKPDYLVNNELMAECIKDIIEEKDYKTIEGESKEKEIQDYTDEDIDRMPEEELRKLIKKQQKLIKQQERIITEDNKIKQ